NAGVARVAGEAPKAGSYSIVESHRILSQPLETHQVECSENRPITGADVAVRKGAERQSRRPAEGPWRNPRAGPCTYGDRAADPRGDCRARRERERASCRGERSARSRMGEGERVC